VPRFLADTSAWIRSGQVADRWEDLIESDTLAICEPVALELLWSARGKSEYARLASELEGFVWLAMDDAAAKLALRIQALLAARSQHRGPKPIDLLVAAIADLNDVVLLHYDRHFDAVGRATGQETEWIAPRGSLD
jgi:predicted nucleic acid-binding protein